MPAETHSHGEPVTVDDVLDLLCVIVRNVDDFDPTTTLDEIGLADDLALMAYWDTVVEEYAERGIGEPDFDHLAEATTALELADRTVSLLVDTDDPSRDA